MLIKNGNACLWWIGCGFELVTRSGDGFLELMCHYAAGLSLIPSVRLDCAFRCGNNINVNKLNSVASQF